MGSYLMYRGGSRTVDGMAVLAGRRYLVELIEGDPLSLTIEVDDGEQTCSILYAGLSTFMRDWESPFANLKVDAATLSPAIPFN